MSYLQTALMPIPTAIHPSSLAPWTVLLHKLLLPSSVHTGSNTSAS